MLTVCLLNASSISQNKKKTKKKKHVEMTTTCFLNLHNL